MRLQLAIIFSFLCANSAHSQLIDKRDWQDVRNMVGHADSLADSAQQFKIYSDALTIAKQSSKEHNLEINEFLWLAAAAGRLGQLTADPLEKARLSRVVK